MKGIDATLKVEFAGLDTQTDELDSNINNNITTVSHLLDKEQGLVDRELDLAQDRANFEHWKEKETKSICTEYYNRLTDVVKREEKLEAKTLAYEDKEAKRLAMLIKLKDDKEDAIENQEAEAIAIADKNALRSQKLNAEFKQLHARSQELVDKAKGLETLMTKLETEKQQIAAERKALYGRVKEVKQQEADLRDAQHCHEKKAVQLQAREDAVRELEVQVKSY
jgi:hypothetical protein